MKYDYIKQRVYDILDLPISEITRLQYSSKIPKIFNEATLRIAHSVLPNLREYVIRITVENLPARFSLPPDFISFANEQDAYLDNQPFTLTQFIGVRDVIVSGNEIPGYKPSGVVEYRIFYNAAYPVVSDSESKFTTVELAVNTDADSYSYVEVNTTDIEFSDLLSSCIPYYIAGQLLSRDDKVRSTECLNEFEILLSVLSTDRNERTKEYRSSKGWY